MAVHVDQAGHGGQSLAVQHPRTLGYGHLVPRTHGDDSLALPDHRTVLDHLVAAHGDQSGTHQGDSRCVVVRWPVHADGGLLCLARRGGAGLV